MSSPTDLQLVLLLSAVATLLVYALIKLHNVYEARAAERERRAEFVARQARLTAYAAEQRRRGNHPTFATIPVGSGRAGVDAARRLREQG